MFIDLDILNKNVCVFGYSLNPASLFFASSTSTIPGSASFQRERNLS
jgi:hypothetical protein